MKESLQMLTSVFKNLNPRENEKDSEESPNG